MDHHYPVDRHRGVGTAVHCGRADRVGRVPRRQQRPDSRRAYALDPADVHGLVCQQHGLYLFQARRPDIECFGRVMDQQGWARATIAR